MRAGSGAILVGFTGSLSHRIAARAARRDAQAARLVTLASLLKAVATRSATHAPRFRALSRGRETRFLGAGITSRDRTRGQRDPAGARNDRVSMQYGTTQT